MAFSDQALLSHDADFLDRLAACGAVEIDLDYYRGNAPVWASDVVWLVAAAPGFADQYASALASGIERPGNDPAVISDDQIRAAVQALPASGQ